MIVKRTMAAVAPDYGKRHSTSPGALAELRAGTAIWVDRVDGVDRVDREARPVGLTRK